MPETYQIIFLKAGDGSSTANQAVAEKIANATKSPLDRILKQIQQAPFIYKKGLPKSKAENISAALTKLGAHTEVRPEEAEPAPAPASGPSFGGPAASGGFDFGAPSAPPAPPPSPAASGGFDFGQLAPPARGKAADDFSIETPSSDEVERTPSPAPAAGGFGFDFGAASAAPAAPPPKPAPSQFERNEDFGAAPAAPAAKAPPVAPGKKAKKDEPRETVACPRCGAEQPAADECASCGVLMSKAGAAPETAAPAARHARTARPAKAKSKLGPIAIAAAVLIVALGGAWVTGLLNPLRLKLAAASDPLLREYGASVPKPAGRLAIAQIGKPEKAKEVLEGFVGRSTHIQEELGRLSALSSVAEFEQGDQALQGEVEAYQQDPANALMKRVSDLVRRYYTVGGVGLSIEGKTYTFRENLDSGGGGAEPLLNEVDIRQARKSAREKVMQQEAARLEQERRAEVNVSFADGFDTGLNPRWQTSGEPAVTPAPGKLRLTAPNQALPAAGMYAIPEPVADYALEVSVSGTSPDASRAGLVIYQDPRAYVGVVKTRAGRADAAQVVTQAGDGYSAPTGATLRIRLERKGPTYFFFAWDEARRNWTQLDRVQPAWADQPTRRIGLVAYNGGGTFEYDDFQLQVGP